MVSVGVGVAQGLGVEVSRGHRWRNAAAGGRLLVGIGGRLNVVAGVGRRRVVAERSGGGGGCWWPAGHSGERRQVSVAGGTQWGRKGGR